LVVDEVSEERGLQYFRTWKTETRGIESLGINVDIAYRLAANRSITK
jgi:hypothetical protein